MADNGLRDLERVASTGDINASLAYASAVGRQDKSACYETLCDVFVSDVVNDGQLVQAEQLFTFHLGRMYVVDQGDRWRMSYFTHDNRFVEEDLDKNLLGGGEKYSQREGITDLGKKGRSMQGSADVSEIIIATYQNKDHSDACQRELIGNVRKALEESVMGNNQLMTASRARYRSQENDLYIPRWNPDVLAERQQGIEVALAGQTYNVRDGQNLDVTETVFNTRNYSLVDETFTD